ncbi:hypothetical protein SDC9_106037 [bioreactor metagenome]|uniref:Uncharacterized protein n=1 Tax=bioreactor metagenome TaxID=1076179 RepID=A0A645B1B0_9ZZZZ
MVGVAVNVTLLPVQILVAEAETETAGVTAEPTVMVTGADVAVAGVAQVAVDVITQVTTSPFVRDAFEYVALFVPTFDPLSFH